MSAQGSFKSMLKRRLAASSSARSSIPAHPTPKRKRLPPSGQRRRGKRKGPAARTASLEDVEMKTETPPGSPRKTVRSRRRRRNGKQKGGHLVSQAEPELDSNLASEEEVLSPFQRMQQKLHGAQFRYLNEQLYTRSSEQAAELFAKDPHLFEVYHRGFRSQAYKWPVNPNDIFIHYLKNKRPTAVVGDFGCGEALISLNVPNTVHSFDLVAANERVTACDIANVPLSDEVLDVAIFSLSLMGVNYLDFIREAWRTLRVGGELKIAEVESRFDSQAVVRSFIAAVQAVGFKLKRQSKLEKVFVMFDFVKTSGAQAKKGNKKARLKSPHQVSAAVSRAPPLKPCKYKKR